jgi:glycosyltransferase involved in cell wall biosynthesis
LDYRRWKPRSAVAHSSSASLREIWQDAAIFVSPDDANALSRALNDLIANPQLRTNLSNRGRARALKFSPQKMAQEYIAVFQACMRCDSHSATEEPPLIFEEVAA